MEREADIAAKKAAVCGKHCQQYMKMDMRADKHQLHQRKETKLILSRVCSLVLCRGEGRLL